jgi:PhnB protein
MKLPDGHANLFPYLMVRDAPGLVAWLEDVYGAEVLGRTVMDGRLANARVRIGQTAFMVSEAGGGMDPMPAALYLFVEDCDATWAKALAAGATALYPVDDMPYGDRQGGVIDPFGNAWFISTRIADGGYAD